MGMETQTDTKQTDVGRTDDTGQDSTPELLTNQEPAYIRLSNMERGRFLIQIGPFTSSEKDVFNFLCQRWEPEMAYDMLFYELGQDDLMASFGSLMAKLRRYALGLIIHQNIDGRLEPGTILLCTRYAPIFYAKLIEQAYQRIQVNLDMPFPMASDDDFCTAAEQKRIYKAEYEQLCRLMKKEDPIPQEPLVGVATYFGKIILLPAFDVQLPIEIARSKLQSYFSDKRVTALFKRLNYGFREHVLKTQPFEIEPEFWLDACSRFLDRRNDFENAMPPPNESYYQAGLMLRRIARLLVEARTMSKATLLRRENDMSTILKHIRENESALVTTQQYHALFEKYRPEWGNDFEKTIKDFEAKYCVPSPGRKLALLYRWESGIIHAERIYEFCTSCINDMSHQLDAEYVADLQHWLRARTLTWHSAFESSDGFERSVRTAVQKRDRFLFMTLTDSELWSEAIAAGVRNIAKSHQKTELQRRMHYFFEANLKTMKPFKQIFNLRLEDLFERGFRSMNVMRRTLLRIFGIYRSLKLRFYKFSTGHGLEESSSRRARKIIQAAQREVRKKGRSRRAYTTSDDPLAAQKQQYYSKTERDTAWQEFQHKLTDKK